MDDGKQASRRALYAGKGGMRMTREEYYELLKVKHDQTDWNNLDSIKAYNEYARELRHLIQEDE